MGDRDRGILMQSVSPMQSAPMQSAPMQSAHMQLVSPLQPAPMQPVSPYAAENKEERIRKTF